MSESRGQIGQRLHALSVAAQESRKIAEEDRETRNLEIFRVYETGEWTLEEIANACDLSIPFIHRTIAKIAARD